MDGYTIVGVIMGLVLFLLLIGFCIHTYRFMYRVPRALEEIQRLLEDQNAKNHP